MLLEKVPELFLGVDLFVRYVKQFEINFLQSLVGQISVLKIPWIIFCTAAPDVSVDPCAFQLQANVPHASEVS